MNAQVIRQGSSYQFGLAGLIVGSRLKFNQEHDITFSNVEDAIAALKSKNLLKKGYSNVCRLSEDVWREISRHYGEEEGLGIVHIFKEKAMGLRINPNRRVVQTIRDSFSQTS